MEPRLPIDGSQSTLLVISDAGAGSLGLPLYSARGLQQTLTPIAAATMQRRTVNGALVSLAPPQFSLYQSRITGSDQEPPAVDGVWPGYPYDFECIVELAFQGAPQRPIVPGSIRTDPVDGSTFYRPILTMLVTAFALNSDEWGATVGWTLDAEELGGL